jgi:ankyrin repeat protein
MKHLLLTTIAAVVLVGCGESVPDISIHDAIVLGGDIEAVKQHLAAGVDVNAKDDDGGTPMYWAAVNGRKEIVELLIAKGADVNAKSKRGTPLHFAAKGGHREVAKLLIAKGADVNAKTGDGVTPLDWAEDVKNWQRSETKVAKKETADLLRKYGGKTGEELK